MIADRLTSDLTYGYKLHGYFDETNQVDDINYLGNIDDMEAYLASQKIDEVYIATDQEISSRIDYVIELCERYMIRLKFVPAFFNHTKSRRVSIDYYGNIPVMMFREEPLTNPFNRLIKKGFDLIFSLIVILGIFTWLFPILILFVKLSSKGPIFFKQIRSGENNNEFICYKFRTMKVNSVSDEIQASKNDTRITKIGAFMRKTNLDELPQFFNVLIGNMSVVGPRPHMLKHTEHYSELMQNYLVRHLSKPGITGWAQVNGFRGEIEIVEDLENRVNSDIWYVENWSFLLDIKIIIRTFTNVLFSKGVSH